MTMLEQIVTVGACVLGTMATRFLPFLLFGRGEKPPAVIRYLGDFLPGAVFALLIVYCLKDVSFLTGYHGAPELIAIAATTALHLAFRQMLISIFGGTALYMVLVQFVFP